MPKRNKVGGAYVPPSCLGAALRNSKTHKETAVGLLLNIGQIVLLTSHVEDPFAAIRAVEKHRESRQETSNEETHRSTVQ